MKNKNNAILKYKNISIILVLLLLWYGFVTFLATKTEIGSTVISHLHTDDFSFKTHPREDKSIITGTFTAKHNYLGMVYIRFKEFNRPSDDQIFFRIKDQETGRIIMETPRGSTDLLGLPLFPFGFPPIADSENKQYSFEITTNVIKNTPNITLDKEEPIIITKYQFPKNILAKNPVLLIQFLQKKAVSTYTTSSNLLKLLLLVPFFIAVLWILRKNLQNIFNPFVKNFGKKFPLLTKEFNKVFLKSVKWIKTIEFKQYKPSWTIALILFIVAVIISITVKVWVATLGNNYDIDSWKLVSQIVMRGDSVYAFTHRYNYGPIWSYILGFLGNITAATGADTIPRLHISITFFLALVDVAIAICLWRLYNKLSAFLFLLSPVAILLSGFHGQFDNLAILIGLIGWGILFKSQVLKSNKLYYLSAVIFGLSMMTKHILIFFPFWIFMMPLQKFVTLKKRVIHFITIYAIFLLGFILELLKSPSIHHELIKKGIEVNVIGYKGNYSHSTLIEFLNLFYSADRINDLFQGVPVFKGFTFLFLALTFIFGFVCIKKGIKTIYLLPLYLLSFFAFSPGLADQYLFIPLIAIAIFPNNILFLMFNIISFTYLAIGNSANIANVLTYRIYLGIGNLNVPFYPWSSVVNLTDINAQSWIFFYVILLIIGTNISYLGVPKFKFFNNVILYATFITYLIFIVNLMAFIYLKHIVEGEGRITIKQAQIIQHCEDGTKLNIKKILEKQCNNKLNCHIPFKYLKVKPFCDSHLQIKWTCNYSSTVHPVYFKNYEDITNNMKDTFSCPPNPIRMK